MVVLRRQLTGRESITGDQTPRPWRSVAQVEIATAEWADWFNHRHLYQHCGGIPPANLEMVYYAQNRAKTPADLRFVSI